jgi:hypothetical protein
VVVQAARRDGKNGTRRSRSILIGATGGFLLACSASAPPVPAIPDDRRVSGKVLDVDPTAGRVVFLDAGRRLAVSYGPETIVKSGSVDLSPEDIRPGDRIVVSLDPDSLDQARVIAVAGPRPAKPPTPGEPPTAGTPPTAAKAPLP